MLPPKNWIEKNIDRMMAEIAQDARHQKPLPLSITMSTEAYNKFAEILKSKSNFFPNDSGSFSFLNVPIRLNPRIPVGSFIVERFRNTPVLSEK